MATVRREAEDSVAADYFGVVEPLHLLRRLKASYRLFDRCLSGLVVECTTKSIGQFSDVGPD